MSLVLRGLKRAVSPTEGGLVGKINEIKKLLEIFVCLPPVVVKGAMLPDLNAALWGLWADCLSRWAVRTVTVTAFRGSEG